MRSHFRGLIDSCTRPGQSASAISLDISPTFETIAIVVGSKIPRLILINVCKYTTCSRSLDTECAELLLP